MRSLIALLLLVGPAMAAPRVYDLPEETAVLLPGPNFEVAANNCSGCHSADYTLTQPRNLADPKGFWTAEVVKMRNAYKAPIQDADVPKIIEYLVVTYGK